MNRLYTLFREAAQREPSRRILCGRPGGRWIRFGELHRRAEDLGARLARSGLRRGEIALVRIGNRPAFLTAVLAAWSRGGVVLPVDESLPATSMSDLESLFRPGVVISDAGGRPVAANPSARAKTLRAPGAAMIRLTSGSTGTPRGAVVTAVQAAADGRAIIRKIGIRRDDLNVAVVPLNHTYGFDNVVLPLILQGTPALLIQRALPSLLMRALRGRRPMILPAVPYLIDLLARRPEPPPPWSGLRLCLSAGAPLQAETARRFRALFGLPVGNLYGSSETGGISYDGRPEAETPGGCVGTPLPGVRITIERAKLAGLPSGHGRIVVSGPAVGRGYLPDPSPDFRAGRFRTQDIGRIDASGRLHLAGRLSSLVNVSGRMVNPVEVERALLSLDAVCDAVVLGREDALRGERLEAWVVAPRGEEGESIRVALAKKISAYKVPRFIHVVAAIPRTARGKLDRVRLLEPPSPPPSPRRPRTRR